MLDARRSQASRWGCAVAALACGCAGHGSGNGGFAPTPSETDAEADGGLDGAEDTVSDASQPSLSIEAAAIATSCKPGTYVGSYTGTYEMTIPTTGPVTLTLTQSSGSNGENFVLTTSGLWQDEWGLMAGDASLPLVTGSAMLVGQLDCGNNQFSATAAPGSTFTILGVPSGSFTLSLMGTYDGGAQTLGGTFDYMSNAGNGGGTWQTQWTP